MLITIDPRSGVPVYRQIMDQIRIQILTSGLDFGYQLPSIRDLASQLKINPMTVSKAYFQLEQQGFLERRKGIGLFVPSLDPAQKTQKNLEIFEGIVRNAALAARQLQISEEQAIEMFRKAHAGLENGEGGDHDQPSGTRGTDARGTNARGTNEGSVQEIREDRRP